MVLPFKRNVLMSKITKKGQVTIPKAVRERLNAKHGDEVFFKISKDQVILKKVEKKANFKKFVGFLGKLSGQKTDDIIRELRDIE